MTREELQQIADLLDAGLDAKLAPVISRMDSMSTEIKAVKAEVGDVRTELHQTRILVEDQGKKIQIIAEACSALPDHWEKLNQISDKVDVLNDRMFAVEASARRHKNILQDWQKAE